MTHQMRSITISTLPRWCMLMANKNNTPPLLDRIEVQGSPDLLDDPWLWSLLPRNRRYLPDFMPEGELGGGWYSSECTCPQGSEATEAWVDALASQMAREIKAKPDYRSTEYVGVIYRHTDGRVRAGRILQGASEQAPMGRAIIESGTTPAMVLAVIHNHPELVYDGNDAEKAANNLLSENDWKAAEHIFPDRTYDLTYYIIGTDHQIREYEYQDRQQWLQNLRQFKRNPTEPRLRILSRRLIPPASIPDNLPLPAPCPLHGIMP